jgi:hypothetical protein
MSCLEPSLSVMRPYVMCPAPPHCPGLACAGAIKKVDPLAINVMSGKSYEQEFDLEQARMKVSHLALHRCNDTQHNRVPALSACMCVRCRLGSRCQWLVVRRCVRCPPLFPASFEVNSLACSSTWLASQVLMLSSTTLVTHCALRTGLMHTFSTQIPTIWAQAHANEAYWRTYSA